jgi:hypothetical protein
MLKRVYALIVGAIFLVTPVSIFFVDIPPGLAEHRTKKKATIKESVISMKLGLKKG